MRTLLVDFDGVIHAYSHGWGDGTAYDPPMPGAKEALAELSERYEVVIFSTRDAGQIAAWLIQHEFPPYEVTNHKRPATAIIDDRAVRFVDWPSALAETQQCYG